MCKFAYEKTSALTGKSMIFCKFKSNEKSLSQLCISQRFCPEKDKYIEINQKLECKNYE